MLSGSLPRSTPSISRSWWVARQFCWGRSSQKYQVDQNPDRMRVLYSQGPMRTCFTKWRLACTEMAPTACSCPILSNLSFQMIGPLCQTHVHQAHQMPLRLRTTWNLWRMIWDRPRCTPCLALGGQLRWFHLHMYECHSCLAMPCKSRRFSTHH